MIKMKVEGSRSLVLQFQAMSRAAQRGNVRRAARAGTRPIVAEARRRAPRSKRPRHPKGHAYKTIKAVEVQSWPDKAEFAIGATDWGWYLGLHEVGTSRFPAQPHLRPAIESQRHRVTDEMGTVFRESIMRAAMRARGKK